MSERMTNVDIEDVLSSIRRLVTEDGGARARKETRAADPGRLVLTPDFRVVGEAAPEALDAAEPESAAPAAEAAQEAPRRIVPTRPRRATLHLTEPLNRAQLGEGEAEEESAEEDLPVLPRSARNRSVYDILAEFEGADRDWVEATASLKGRIAVLEAAVAERGEDWDPDGSEANPMAYLTETRAAIAAAEEAGEAEEAPFVEVDTPAPEARLMQLLPRRAAPEAVADAAPERAPEAPAEADEIAAVEAEMPSDAVLSDLDLPEADASEAAHPEEAADLGEETLLDEETLRAMIRQVVREELQGVLGERITRNVRKLVRAEINRILSSRDFE